MAKQSVRIVSEIRINPGKICTKYTIGCILKREDRLHLHVQAGRRE